MTAEEKKFLRIWRPDVGNGREHFDKHFAAMARAYYEDVAFYLEALGRDNAAYVVRMKYCPDKPAIRRRRK